LSDQPKDVIVNSFKGQIEKAEKDTGWLSFNNINYKKIKVDAYRAVIKRDPLFFGPPGIGTEGCWRWRGSDERKTNQLFTKFSDMKTYEVLKTS